MSVIEKINQGFGQQTFPTTILFVPSFKTSLELVVENEGLLLIENIKLIIKERYKYLLGDLKKNKVW